MDHGARPARFTDDHRGTTLNEPKDVAQQHTEDLQDELRWERLFKSTQPQLIAAARRAKQEIAAGKASSMDYDQL